MRSRITKFAGLTFALSAVALADAAIAPYLKDDLADAKKQACLAVAAVHPDAVSACAAELPAKRKNYDEQKVTADARLKKQNAVRRELLDPRDAIFAKIDKPGLARLYAQLQKKEISEDFLRSYLNGVIDLTKKERPDLFSLKNCVPYRVRISDSDELAGQLDPDDHGIAPPLDKKMTIGRRDVRVACKGSEDSSSIDFSLTNSTSFIDTYHSVRKAEVISGRPGMDGRIVVLLSISVDSDRNGLPNYHRLDSYYAGITIPDDLDKAALPDEIIHDRSILAGELPVRETLGALQPKLPAEPTLANCLAEKGIPLDCLKNDTAKTAQNIEGDQWRKDVKKAEAASELSLQDIVKRSHTWLTSGQAL